MTGCLIYDSAGHFVASQVNGRALVEAARQPSRLKQLAEGLRWLLAGLALIWWDWRGRWTIMIGIIIGTRFAFTGVAFLLRSARPRRRS
jgi:hypothetical protein